MKVLHLLVLIPLMVEPFPDDLKVFCPPMPVQTEPGQDVVLSCRVEPQINLTGQTVEWTRGTDVVVHRYQSQGDDKTDQHQRFNNRTFLNHQNLEDGNVSLRLNNVTKEDEGNYSCCLRKKDWFRCSNITLIVVPQRDKRTNNRPESLQANKSLIMSTTPFTSSSGDTSTNQNTSGADENPKGSALSPGVIGGLVVLGVLGVLGVLAVLCHRRTRSDLQTDSASIALRNMRKTEPSQPPSDEGGVNPGQVSIPLMMEEGCSRLLTEKKQLEEEHDSCDGTVVL